MSNKFSERPTRKRLPKIEQTLLHDRRQSALTAVGRHADFSVDSIPMCKLCTSTELGKVQRLQPVVDQSIITCVRFDIIHVSSQSFLLFIMTVGFIKTIILLLLYWHNRVLNTSLCNVRLER